MAIEVRVPNVGESVKEAVIHRWHKENGAVVNIDEVLLELETDKATVEVVAEAAGKLEIIKANGAQVKIGETIARIDTAVTVQAAPAAIQPSAVTNTSTTVMTAEQPARAVANATAPIARSANADALSPAVRRIVAENNLQTDQLTGTGRGGRLTKADVLSVQPNAAAPARPANGTSTIPVKRGERREPMTLMRRRIAERLVEAQQTTAMLTTFNEIDMSAVLKMRASYKEPFEKKYGTPLGFMGFFVKATIEALKAFPRLNGWVDGSDVVYHDYYDIGVAVSTERGLVVPVVRNADQLSFSEVELAIAAYAKKARDGKISVDDMSGGTFTVSNGGVFGSLMSTPILNPPQSGILGMHKTQERPVVVLGQVVIRPMMYVAMSYDHRIVDGKEAVQFLVKIKDAVEDPGRILLGV